MSERLHQGDLLPEFQYDTPYEPGKSFYEMLDKKGPIVMVFLRNFGHPLSRHYILQYSQTIEQLMDARLVCVVRTKPQVIFEAMPEDQLPYELICDAEGALYEHFNVRTVTSRLRSYSFKAMNILKKAKKQGFRQKRGEPQQLPLTLVVSQDGEVLFAHYGQSLTDLPEDCAAMQCVVEKILDSLPPMATEVQEEEVFEPVEDGVPLEENWSQTLETETEEVLKELDFSQQMQPEEEEPESPVPPKVHEEKRNKKEIDFAKLGF